MTEEKRTAGSRDICSASELYDVYDNCDSDEKWIQEQQRILRDEAMGIRHFQTIDSDVLFEKQLEKRKYIVRGLLPEGLTVLSGDPKVGKSFFALSLSVSVAKGIPFLCFPTVKSDVLYFSFEDDEKRLQQRLFEMSDDNFTGLTFSSDVMHLDVDFIQSVENYLQDHPSTKLIVVDTLNSKTACEPICDASLPRAQLCRQICLKRPCADVAPQSGVSLMKGETA